MEQYNQSTCLHFLFSDVCSAEALWFCSALVFSLKNISQTSSLISMQKHFLVMLSF